jgi:hypothetical protein
MVIFIKSIKKNRTSLKTIKVSSENHKSLNLFKIQNDMKTMDEAIGKLLRLENMQAITEPSNSTDDTDENFN